MCVVLSVLWSGILGSSALAAMLGSSLLNSVVAIENRVGSTKSYAISGTGVLVWYSKDAPAEKGKPARIFLITAKHVLEKKKSIYLRFNMGAGGPGQPFELLLRDSRGKSMMIHPADPKVDVAAVQINPRFLEERGVHIDPVPEMDVADSKKMHAEGVRVGDSVHILGFPSLAEGAGRKYVIVRSGMISCLEKGVIDGKSFLVEAMMFPGNSGSPVFIRPTTERIVNTSAVRQSYLVGIVHKNLQHTDVANSVQTGMTRVIFMENSGLAAVLPMDHVNSMILKYLGRDK